MNKNTDRPTYPELMKAYMDSGFHKQFSPREHSLFQQLIFIANGQIFPAELSVSNTELAEKAHITPSHIPQVRQKLFERAKVDGIPIFTYIEGSRWRCGKVRINYPLITRLSPINLLSTPPKGDCRVIDGVLSRGDPNSNSNSNINTTPLPPNFGNTGSRVENLAEGVVDDLGGDSEKIQDHKSDISDLTAAIRAKWRGQLTLLPSPSSCRAALEHFSIQQLEEATQRAPKILKNCTPSAALNLILACAGNPGNGKRPRGAYLTDEDRTRLAEMREELEIVNGLEVTEEHFPDPSSFGVKSTPEEIRDRVIAQLEGNIAALAGRKKPVAVGYGGRR